MDPLIPKSKSVGFSVLELMIAMSILFMVLSAVILVSFGDQTFLINSDTSAEAQSKAQALLEKARASSRKDFNLVNPIASTSDGIYQTSLDVKLLPDFLTKEVSALINWQDEGGKDQSLTLTTLLTNFDNPAGTNTCDSTFSSDPASLGIKNPADTDFATLVGDPAGIYTISDVDAYKGLLYVVASSVSAATKPTFFIFDSEKLISDPSNALLAKMDNEGTSPVGTTSSGLSTIRVAEDQTTNKIYAYAGNAYAANYTSCNPVTTKNCGQLEIFDVTDPESPLLAKNLKLTTTPAIAGITSVSSVFYQKGYLLLGLVSTNGPEFHIVDLHEITSILNNPSHTVTPLSSVEISHDVNALSLRGNYAYVAIPNDATVKELQVFDITSPSTPHYSGGFNMTSGGNGKSIYLVGDRVYFGNTVPNAGNDFHILDNTIPNVTLGEIGGQNLPTSANAIIVRSGYAFVLTNKDIEVFNIGDPESLSPLTVSSPLLTLSLPYNSSSPVPEPSMDCEGDTFYISSNNSTKHGALYVLK